MKMNEVGGGIPVYLMDAFMMGGSESAFTYKYINIYISIYSYREASFTV